MSLLKRHADILRDSALPNHRIKARGYSSVRRDEAGLDLLDGLGFTCTGEPQRPGLLIPLLDRTGEVWGYQYRPDVPRLDRHKGPDHLKPIRYENPRGQQMRLDFPLGLMHRLSDKTAPLIVTEGTKKSDAATAAGWAALTLAGVTCWKTAACLADWRYVPIAARDVYVCFDSDAVTKAPVQQQEQRLAAFLLSRGARVHVCRLTPTASGAKVGLDDYIAAGGDVAALLDTARDPQEASA